VTNSFTFIFVVIVDGHFHVVTVRVVESHVTQFTGVTFRRLSAFCHRIEISPANQLIVSPYTKLVARYQLPTAEYTPEAGDVVNLVAGSHHEIVLAE
jgi:hypothetical protein